MKLQYQMSSGRWAETDDRTEDFLTRCEQFNGVDATGKIVSIFKASRPLTRDEVEKALLMGIELRNGNADWYSNCRDGETKLAERRAAVSSVKMVKCDCGHTIPSISAMSASLGSSCPDCYDRLSC